MKPVQLPLLLYDDTARSLERMLRQISYDDALVRRGWRLEYLHLAVGFPHYRLYRRQTLIGIIDIRSPKHLPVIQSLLAAYLAGVGFTPTNAKRIICGARTSLAARKHYLPELFSIYERPPKTGQAAHKCHSEFT